MSENLFETGHDVTKKSKIKQFYERNKIKIFSALFSFTALLLSLSIYLEVKKNKRIALSENYVDARVYIAIGEKAKAVKLLKEIIFENDSTYSTLSLFLILNENLLEDQKGILNLFNHILENCKFEKEISDLIIYKKALLESTFVSENELLKSLKPLTNSESLWKHHALLLLGDYYVSKKENIKAREFYSEILKIKNLHKEFYNRTQIRLELTNE